MATFDLEKAAKVLGSQGGTIVDALGSGYGAPQCIISITEAVLSVLPSDLLGAMATSLKDARDAANDATAMITKKLFLDSGIIEFDTQTGRWKFVGDSSLWGSDTNDGGLLNNIGGLIGSLGAALAFGSQMYNNINMAQSQINGILDCVDQFRKQLASQKGSGAMAATLGMGQGGTCTGCTDVPQAQCDQFAFEAACVAAGGTWQLDPPTPICYGADGSTEQECLDNGGSWLSDGPIEPPGGVGSFGPAGPNPDTQFALARAEMQQSMDFANNCNSQLEILASIFEARRLDPTLEPIINSDIPNVPQIVSGTSLRYTSAAQWQNLITGTDADSEIFRLEYGPPKAKQGQFILTIDGLYYDSQTGGVPDVPIKIIPPGTSYLHDYAPNLGGKGVAIGEKELSTFMDTLFDPSIVSVSSFLLPYYDGDHMLQQLIGTRNKHINDLNTSLKTATADGSGTAIIYNMQQAIVSQNAKHTEKIDKRKKQIEIAVVTPGSFGSVADVPSVGTIPINDFTYLKDYNVQVSLELQKNLTFKQGEVKDIILPLKPKYVSASGTEPGLVAEHLMVPTIGAGGIIFDSSTTGDQKTTLLNLTDDIVTDGLFAAYNFMEATAELPSLTPYASSSKWGVLNCNASSLQKGLGTDNPIISNNAKLLASTPSSVFVSGLSIPKLTGLVRYNSTGTTTSLGQAVRLPDSPDFRDLFYRMEGGTVESWVYVPGINTSSTDYSEPDGEWGPGTFNRILLGSENNGGVNEDIAVSGERIENSFSNEHVRGFLMGFSRDRQVVSNLDISNDQDDNPVENRCFFAAPTTSYNSSGISFISPDYCINNSDMFKMKIDMNTTGSHGKSFNDVSGQFMHIVYTVDPSSDTMSIYLDGVLMGASGIQSAFGTFNDYSFLALPTYYNRDAVDSSLNSFTYNAISTQNAIFTNGPKLNDRAPFTPWILGGGYTDGLLRWEGDSNLPVANGFMNSCHGKTSGLNGFVGSTKFYNRSLSAKDINKNYRTQSPYFKNINI